MHDPSSPVAASLWRLAKDIANALLEAKSKGEIVSTKVVYISTRVTEFRYDRGNSSSKAEAVQEAVDEWHVRDQYTFLDEKVKGLESYESVKSQLSSEFPDRSMEIALTQFALSIAKEVSPTGTVPTEEQVLSSVITFYDDLSDNDVRWTAEAWLRGIWLEDDKIEIDPRLILRRPTAADFSERREIEVAVWDRRGIVLMPSAIIETEMSARGANELQSHVAALLDTLRLYRVASIWSMKTSMRARSFTRHGGITSPLGLSLSEHQYGLSVSERDEIVTFMERVLPLVPRDPAFSPGSVLNVTYLAIALQRYRDATLMMVPPEARLAFLMSCLEALFQKSNERTELTHRLSQRIAILMKAYGHPPMKVYRDIGAAYDIRSTYIHGSVVTAEKQAEAAQLIGGVLEYARIALLVFMQLPDSDEKDKFINQLEGSVLEDKTAQKLNGQLGKMHVPARRPANSD